MTYNQLLKTIQTLLESHAMIKTAKNVTPQEWLLRDDQPVYPIACYSLVNGSLSAGRQQKYSLQFFFLDKSGMEAEFETDVISDQHSIMSDIINKMRLGSNNYSIDDIQNFNAISDKYEDYLAGVEVTINFTTTADFDGCDMPTN